MPVREHISGTIRLVVIKVFMHVTVVTYGRGSVFPWRLCSDTLYTSGFTDNVIHVFAHNGQE